ncbi:unnamed protein product, partial [Rotaria magnacalcarata]
MVSILLIFLILLNINTTIENLAQPDCQTPFGPNNRYSTQINPVSIINGYFNNDAKLDLAIANDVLNSVSILFNNGDGTFQNQKVYEVGAFPVSVTVGDFNNDAKLDLVTANQAENTISILLNNGNGTFQKEKKYSVGTSPTCVTVGDFNNDTKLDLATTNNDDRTISILF